MGGYNMISAARDTDREGGVTGYYYGAVTLVQRKWVIDVGTVTCLLSN